MKKTIITYFEPFGGRKVNASKEVVLALKNSHEKISLPVSWKRTLPILDKIIESDPHYLFMVGEAGDYPDVTVELVARNISAGTDEDGDKKDKERILRATPKKLFTNFKVDEIPFTNSDNAGRFLCNYVYYLALLRSEVTKVIFIHVPYLHSKGSRKKDSLVRKVNDIINYFIENNKEILIRHNGKVIKVNEENVRELYPELQKEYELPNIIVSVERNEDGGFVMSGRADGYKGRYIEKGDKPEDEGKALNAIYYQILKYQDSLEEEDRQSEDHIELTRRFKLSEYTGSEKLVKQFINLFISRANYSSEFAFYESLDMILEKNLKSVLSYEEEKALNEAKDYVSRLGLEKATELLFKIVRR